MQETWVSNSKVSEEESRTLTEVTVTDRKTACVRKLEQSRHDRMNGQSSV